MPPTSTRFGVSRELMAQGRKGDVRAIGASGIPRIQFSTGTAKALQDFSFEMFNASSGIEDQLDQQASAEAQVEGATDGATGNFETRDYTTIRSRAYNKAGIETFVATLETRSITAMAQLRTQYANDPNGLQMALDAYHEGTAAEIDKVSPGAGSMYRQRQTMRTLPAVEAARDSAYKLSKDQAEAAMIESNVALEAELKEHASDLFSDNPAQSQAAASAIGMVGQQYMRIYSAVDPATGRPLYSSKERAAAHAAFKEKIFTNATLSWFDSQENKADAYIKLTSGEMKIDLNVTGVDFKGASSTVTNAMRTAANEHDVGFDDLAVIAKIESNFNPDAQNPKSSAGGLFQFIDSTASEFGLVNKKDPFQSSDAAARLMKANRDRLEGALGRKVGIGELYLAHQQGAGGATKLLSNPNALAVDIVGKDAVRLNGGNHNMTAQQFANIWVNKANKVANQNTKTQLDIRTSLSPSGLKSLESEMRSRITFSNTLADRAEREEEKALNDFQASSGFELSNRLYNGGKDDVPALSRDEVVEAVRNDVISPVAGEALIKALAEDKPANSDRTTYEEALRRMYSGENIYEYIIGNTSRLSPSDASSLLSKNQSLNVTGEGTLSKNEQFQFDRLRDLLTPDAMMANIDPSAEVRKFSALDEFRQRVDEGENSRDVAADIADRADRDFKSLTNTAIDKMIRPRFSVGSEGKKGQIDIKSSAIELSKAKNNGLISEASYRRQVALLRRWDELQKGLKE